MLLFPASDYTGDGETVTFADDVNCRDNDAFYDNVIKYARNFPHFIVAESGWRDTFNMYGTISFGTPSLGILGYFLI